MPNYTVSGRIVALDGTPVYDAQVQVLEISSLTVEVELSSDRTDAQGRYLAAWSQTSVPSPWDMFVRATLGSLVVDSRVISDPTETSLVVDLVLGEGEYVGRCELDRVAAKIAPLLGSTAPKDVPTERVEWLAKRADVFPLYAAAYVQAHRLADGRTIKPESCYAFLRAGLPSSLAGLLRVGEAAWESALRAAWANEIIPLPGTGSPEDCDAEVTTEIEAMRGLLVDAAVAVPIEGVNNRLIFNAAGLTEAQQRTFAQLWLDHEGTLSEFWATVSGSSLAAEVPLLQFSVGAAVIARNYLETIVALQAERTATNISTIADTAAWSVADWDTMLDTRSVTPPEEITGADATERRQNYARALFNIVEDSYPTLSLRHSIARETTPPPGTDFLATFFTNNLDFDIVRSTVAVYLDGASSPWTGIDSEDQAQARQNLERVQRVYRLTPRIGRYAATKVLLDAGIESASQVVRRTKSEFVAQFGPLFSAADHHPEALAEEIWHNATKVHAMTIAVASQFGLAKNNAETVPLSFMEDDPFAGQGNGLEALSTILGNLDYCACEQCRSVFSPAAYLADLLKFLDDRGALATLLERRPDIAHILLDCDNTNTVLPYIDLVNELLEAYVLNPGEPPDPPALPGDWSNQTTWKAAELRLHPEHVQSDCYETSLPALVHPWTLPFSLPTLEARTYLQHLGVPRHELMRAYAEAEPDEAYQNGIAADVLGMSAVEFEIVAGTFTGNASTDDREFWGFANVTEDDGWVSVLNGTHESKGDIGELLVRASITLAELQELLALDYINPDGNYSIQWLDSCDLGDAVIEYFDAAASDRMHRFIRLQRNSGIPARMLNVLVRDALGGTLDAASLRSLADIALLEQRFRLGWDVIATWWATVIDPREYGTGQRSLYRRRFLAKDLGDDQLFQPAGDLTQLFGESPEAPITAEQLPRILAGLGIKDADYRAIVDPDFITETQPPADPGPRFSFANLTTMFKIVTLARALKLSISDFLRLAGSGGLTGENPFTSPAATAHFVALVDGIRASGLSIGELDWLLRHEIVGREPLDTAAVGRSLAELARGLDTIEAEAALLADPEGVALPGNLAELLAEGDVTTTLEIVAQTSTLTVQADREQFIDDTFAGILDLAEAKAILANYATEPDIAKRRAWLLGGVVGHLRRRALVFDTIAASLGIPADVAKALVTKVLLTDPQDPNGNTLFEVFRLPFASESQIAAGIDATSHPEQFAAWTRLAKAALICRRLELRADEVEWYRHSTWLDLNSLPLDANDPDASFAEWEALRQALDLRELSRRGEIAFQQVESAGNFGEAMQILADHAGWDAVALAAVSTAIGYDAVEDLVREVAPARLRRIVEIADRLGHDRKTIRRLLERLQELAFRLQQETEPSVVQAVRRLKLNSPGEARTRLIQ
ncbi:MAG: hypothetical protein HC927_00370 [Deltaproteobacteria bacterium]|nr:hypothetical protein [Deltaproteobacteria bacterium]